MAASILACTFLSTKTSEFTKQEAGIATFQTKHPIFSPIFLHPLEIESAQMEKMETGKKGKFK